MEKTSLYKSKAQKYIYTIVFIICLVLCIYIGTRDYSKDKASDNERFSMTYNQVSKDNVYKYVNANEVLNVLNGRSGIVLMGFPQNKWTNYYASIINEVAKEEKIKEIYYYDFLSDREDNNGTYETIVSELEVYTHVDDLGNSDIYAPTLMVVKDGVVIGYFDEITLLKGTATPDIYFKEDNVARIKDELKAVFAEYKK